LRPVHPADKVRVALMLEGMRMHEAVNVAEASCPRAAGAGAVPTVASPLDRSDRLRLRGHVPVLDGLRGLAILLVLFAHFTPKGGHTLVGAIVRGIASVGSTGVDLFFVLSGFLITGILLEAKGGAHYFRNFYARRTLRIFPLYYGVLFVCFVVVPLIHPPGEAERRVAREQGWLWLYAGNIRESLPHAYFPFNGGWIAMDHFWSLAVEEHFYLVWPLAVFLLGRRAMIGFSLALIGVALGLRAGLYYSPIESMAHYHFTPCRMDELAMGGLLALVARGPRGAAWVRRGAVVALPVALVAVAATWKMEFGEFVLRGTLLGVLFAATLAIVVTCGEGKYSYAAYVLHPLVLTTVLMKVSHERLAELTHSSIAGVFVYMAMGFGLTMGAAWGSWHLYEKHFLKLKKFFEYRR
jgi:peptidoglycan/LPS O-acetylase OafA/YrhL